MTSHEIAQWVVENRLNVSDSQIYHTVKVDIDGMNKEKTGERKQQLELLIQLIQKLMPAEQIHNNQDAKVMLETLDKLYLNA